MTIALTWTIKAVTPYSNITTMITIFWSRACQTTWCLENCFSAITSHVIKQDGSSPMSKPHTTDVWHEHKNPCEDKIQQCATPATSQFYMRSPSLIQRQIKKKQSFQHFSIPLLIKCPHFHAGSGAACTPQWHPWSPSPLHHRQSPILHCCTLPPSPLFCLFLQPNECHRYCMVGLEVLNNNGYCVDKYIH